MSKPAMGQTPTGMYYALVIGINKYQSPLPKLQTAVNDAEAVAKVLSEQYGFQVKLLLDGDATRDNILGAMDQFRVNLHSKDSLLVYYAGHGYADREEDKAYWIPVDAERNSRSRWIIADELTTRMRSDPARHVLVISDSCYSGGLLRDAGIEVRPADRDVYLNKMTTARSRTLMSSGGNEPVADGGGDGHSIFANTVLNALQKTDAREFTAGDLFHDYVLRQVAGNADQIPKYSSIRNSGDDAGDFVFLRNTGKGGIERTGPADSTPVPPAADAAAPNTGARNSNSGIENAPNSVAEMSKRGRFLFNEQEYAEAVELLTQAAEVGDADAQVYLGRAYENGIEVESDYGLAVKWYRRAAEQGNGDGQRYLGHMYEEGWGTRQDATEAARWYRKSAEQGNARGQANLGLLYANGSGVAKDEAEAVKWYRKSAGQGDGYGQFHLGEMYANGSGVAKDESEAVKWYRKSAEQGNVYGQFNLGTMYERGAGIVKDLGVALYWYEKADAHVGTPQLERQAHIQMTQLKDAGVVAKPPLTDAVKR